MTMKAVLTKYFGEERTRYYQSSDAHKAIEGDPYLRYETPSRDSVALYVGGDNGDVCITVCTDPERLDKLLDAILH